MEAALIAIGASVLGGALGAFWSGRVRLRAEREDQIRQRMLIAADEFTTGLVQAQNSLDQVRTWTWIDRDPTKSVRGQAESERLIAELHARTGRIWLLFGDESDSGEAAVAAVAVMRRALHALQRDDDHERFDLEFARSHKLHSVFVRDALGLIRDPARVKPGTGSDYPLNESLARLGVE